MWWRDAVIYQIYPRSFQDTDGDGVGALRGIEQRLDHVAALGADAVWLSPIYPSPLADFGYDVAEFKDVDRVFGTLEDPTRCWPPRTSAASGCSWTSCPVTPRSSTRGSATGLLLPGAAGPRLAKPRGGGHAGGGPLRT